MSDVNLDSQFSWSGVRTGMEELRAFSTKTASGIQRDISGMFSGVISVAAIVGGLKLIVDEAVAIHREAERFGIDAEQLQTIGNAAKEIGIPLASVAKGLNLLELNAQKALDPTTKEALALENLGISARKFAALDVQEKFLTLADAYAASAKDGQAYADVAELIGRRNTELIPLLAQGRQAILDQGKAAGLMSDKTVESLAKAGKAWEQFINQIKVGVANAIVYFQDFGNWYDQKVANKVRGALGLQLIPLPSQTNPSRTAIPSGGGGAPIDITDISAGGGGGLGGGGGGSGGSSGALKTKIAGLAIDQKINELLEQREFLMAALNDPEEQQDEHAASQADLKRQIRDIDRELGPLEQIIANEELKGVQAADLKILKSQDRVALDELDLQIRDALNRGDEYGAFLLQSQADTLKINLDYDEKIQKALDDANIARQKGLELTAQENELLAQQLETERQATLALEQQRQEQQRQRIALGPSPLTIGALAADNLRLGATSDVYAAALAASRGLKPGTPAYDRLVEQISAQDRLRELSGTNLGFADQLNRDKLVQWFAGMQQQQANQTSAQQHQQEIAYWQAIAAGKTPPAGNPYTALYGTTPYSPVIPSKDPGTNLSQLVTQGDTTNQLLTQIAANTQIVHV